MGPQCNHRCPYKRKAGGRFEKQEEDNMTTEAATVLWPQANEHGGLLEAGRGKERLSPEGLQREQALDFSPVTLVPDFWSLEP